MNFAIAVGSALAVATLSLLLPQAQAAKPALQLTQSGRSLEECYSAALAHSETLGISQEAITQAEEHIQQASGGLYPSINGVASRYWQDSNTSAGGFYPPIQDTVKLTVAQPLFRGLRDFAGLKLTHHLEDASVNDRKAAEVQLYKDVAQAYYTVLSLEHDMADLQTELKLNAQRVGELQGRIRIGRSRVSEVLTIQSAAASLRSQTDLVRGQIGAARDMLAFQTGLDREIPLRDIAAPPPAAAGIDHYLSQLEARPEVAASRSRVEASEDNIGVQKGAHLPNLDLTGDYFFVRPGVLADSKWDVQLLLTVPIYAGGATSSRTREAASLEHQAELSLSRARRSAIEEVRSLYSTVISDQAQIQSLDAASRLSERNYTEQSKEYRLGLVTNIDVLQSMTTWQASLRALDRARYTLHYDLERLEASAALKPLPSSS
jgi:outer membrane protein